MNKDNSELSEKELKRLKRLEEKEAKRRERKLKGPINRAVRYLVILAIIGASGYLLVKMSQAKKFPKVGAMWLWNSRYKSVEKS